MPPWTTSGPPPIASVTSLQVGVRMKRRKRFVPAGTSAANRVAPVPRARTTPPPRGIAVPPFVGPTCETVPRRSVFGVVGGSDGRTASSEPAIAGVAAPQERVKRLTPFFPGIAFRRIGRRPLTPLQMPL